MMPRSAASGSCRPNHTISPSPCKSADLFDGDTPHSLAVAVERAGDNPGGRGIGSRIADREIDHFNH